eukprot:9035577-Pyramimonas_sp.AAC.1
MLRAGERAAPGERAPEGVCSRGVQPPRAVRPRRRLHPATGHARHPHQGHGRPREKGSVTTPLPPPLLVFLTQSSRFRGELGVYT